MTWSTAGTLQYSPDLVLGISDLVQFGQIWSDLVIRVTPIGTYENSPLVNSLGSGARVFALKLLLPS